MSLVQGFFIGCSLAVCRSEVTSGSSLFPSELTVWLLEAWSLTTWDPDLTGCLNVLVTRQLAIPEAVPQGIQDRSLGFLSPNFRSGIHHFATFHSLGVNHLVAHMEGRGHAGHGHQEVATRVISEADCHTRFKRSLFISKKRTFWHSN